MTGQGRWVEREQGRKLHPGLPQGVRASRTRFESKGKDFHSPGNQVEGIQPPALTKGPGVGWGGVGVSVGLWETPMTGWKEKGTHKSV